MALQKDGLDRSSLGPGKKKERWIRKTGTKFFKESVAMVQKKNDGTFTKTTLLPTHPFDSSRDFKWIQEGFKGGFL